MYSQVTKIKINRKTKEAYGVRMVRNGRPQTVRARREVIVSAGAIGGPQLLMLSGVGKDCIKIAFTNKRHYYLSKKFLFSKKVEIYT